ncbi:MAG: OmpA family protein [Sphingobacteriales bacterium]|nr:MAG: OmpA family protein [Sphingobacteriales bacterium]
MNYSTLKKTVALSLVTAFAIAANAQDSTMTTTTTSAKTFGGRKQFRTMTVGVFGGATAPGVLLGGRNDLGANQKLGDATFGLYYGINLRKQLSNTFGIQANIARGEVIAYNKQQPFFSSWAPGVPLSTAKTEVGYDVNLSGVLNVFTFDFIKRTNAAKFYVTAGFGYMAYNVKLYESYKKGDGTPAADFKGKYGDDKNNEYMKATYVPVGLGFKFRLSEIVSLDLGYDMKFIDADNFDGYYAKSNLDKFSVYRGGLEFVIGNKTKPDLNYVNPIAMMYDELKDPALRQEVEALKGRVTNVEQAVTDLKKDTDGDGVADQFDKDNNTPAGAAVDASGRILDTDGDGIPDYKDTCPTEKGTTELNGCPVAEGTETAGGVATSKDNIQFEFNSSVLKTASYATLDRMVSMLNASKSAKMGLAGHASIEGTSEYNMQLSIDRATAVKTYLVNAGVDSKKVIVKGYGETRPIASNDTEEGRMLNRRVEFKK